MFELQQLGHSSILQRVLSPWFVFRPDIFIRACWRKIKSRPKVCVAKTAWGDWLEIEPRRFIGGSVYLRGVHEMPVCEILWRLVDPGETVVDAGANIGVMTSILSMKAGQSGRVLAVEPHPELFEQLKRNVHRWPRRNVELFKCALSERGGKTGMGFGAWFSANEGTARIETQQCEPRFEVDSVRLDDLLAKERCALLKLDVEGHESPALSGAERLLARQGIRDVVFESTWEFPGPAHCLLLEQGYRLFDLTASFTGVVLSVPARRTGPPNRLSDYVATLDSVRALNRVRPRGWRVLRPQPFRNAGGADLEHVLAREETSQ